MKQDAPNLDALNQDALKPDALDAILQSEETLVPSSGFLAGVMERVQEEAAAPPSIPFPWKRVVPSAVLAAAALVWVFVLLLRQIQQTSASISAPEAPFPLTFSGPLTQPMLDAAWVALALGISLASWWLSRRIMGRSGLL